MHAVPGKPAKYRRFAPLVTRKASKSFFSKASCLKACNLFKLFT